MDKQTEIYKDCIQKQLDEIDMLSSIFCNPGEIHIYDPSIISDFNEYIKGQNQNLNSCLEYSIFIKFNCNKFDIRIGLPHLYPLIENANITLRGEPILKNDENIIHEKIKNFINTLDKNENYIYQVVSWIQDNLENFIKITTKETSSNINTLETCKLIEFERLWIYSHHIKNKIKLQRILQEAHNLNLTGFCKSGRPGIICVEGLKKNTQEFWKIIRQMPWKKITLKKSECKQKSIEKFDDCRRFKNFTEEFITNMEDERTNNNNMKLFMKYLDNHNCSYIKHEIFGFE